MDDLARFCCQNSRCSDFGRHDAGNLTVTGRLGKFRQYRLLYCRACRSRFSERKGTPLYRAHLPADKVLSILEHVREGCGVRKTARLVKVHPDTVSRYSHAAGDHARAAHDDLVAHSPQTREIQMDEKWSFVAKKEQNCAEDDPEDHFRGDCWDHVAFDPEHRLVVSVVPGERTAESVEELVGDVKQRLGGGRLGGLVGVGGRRPALGSSPHPVGGSHFLALSACPVGATPATVILRAALSGTGIPTANRPRTRHAVESESKK